MINMDDKGGNNYMKCPFVQLYNNVLRGKHGFVIDSRIGAHAMGYVCQWPRYRSKRKKNRCFV